jgi:Major Facilitator Superfamily
VISVLIGSAVLFALFIVVERFAAEPVLPLSLFKNQVFASTALLSLGVGAAILSLAYYLPLFLQGVLGESATNTGELITPLTVSIVITSVLSGFLIARTGRYQWLAISGALLLSIGVFLLSRMQETTQLDQATIFMVLTGLGLGVFFSILTLAVQNAVPQTQLGVGTAAIRYTQQAGGTLGVAVVGTVVNNTVANDIAAHLPSGTSQLTPAGIAAATNPQVLVNPTYQQQLVHTTQGHAAQAAVAAARAHGAIPSGPGAASAIAAISSAAEASATHLLGEIFIALKHSLTLGIEHGLTVLTAVCVGMLVLAFALKDVPLQTGHAMPEPATAATGTAATPEASSTDPDGSTRQ